MKLYKIRSSQNMSHLIGKSYIYVDARENGKLREAVLQRGGRGGGYHYDGGGRGCGNNLAVKIDPMGPNKYKITTFIQPTLN